MQFSELAFLCARSTMTIKQLCVIEGGAKGIDAQAGLWAELYGHKHIRCPADWDTYGRGAGYRRNAEMVAMAHAVIVFWDGKSRGTAHIMRLATDKNMNHRFFSTYNFSRDLVERLEEVMLIHKNAIPDIEIKWPAGNISEKAKAEDFQIVSRKLSDHAKEVLTHPDHAHTHGVCTLGHMVHTRVVLENLKENGARPDVPVDDVLAAVQESIQQVATTCGGKFIDIPVAVPMSLLGFAGIPIEWNEDQFNTTVSMLRAAAQTLRGLQFSYTKNNMIDIAPEDVSVLETFCYTIDRYLPEGLLVYTNETVPAAIDAWVDDALEKELVRDQLYSEQLTNLAVVVSRVIQNNTYPVV